MDEIRSESGQHQEPSARIGVCTSKVEMVLGGYSYSRNSEGTATALGTVDSST